MGLRSAISVLPLLNRSIFGRGEGVANKIHEKNMEVKI